MFNLWKPWCRPAMEATWAPVKETGRMAWYFNDNYPWLSMLFCAPVIGLWYWCTDQYIVQRALGAPNETQARRGSICAAYLEAAARVHLHYSGHDLFRTGDERQERGVAADHRRRGRQGDSRTGTGGVSAVGGPRAAGRRARHGRRRAAGGLDEFAGRRFQCLGHAVHDRLLLEDPTRMCRSTDWCGSAAWPPPSWC